LAGEGQKHRWKDSERDGLPAFRLQLRVLAEVEIVAVHPCPLPEEPAWKVCIQVKDRWLKSGELRMEKGELCPIGIVHRVARSLSVLTMGTVSFFYHYPKQSLTLLATES
jgi:hypothetical protein